MFVNFSNHPHDKWDEQQLKEARIYGDVIDVPFPNVDADASEEDVRELAETFSSKIAELVGNSGAAMVQGEFTLVYAVINLLKKKGIKVLSACSGRNVTEVTDESGSIVRKSVFVFKRFREYL